MLTAIYLVGAQAVGIYYQPYDTESSWDAQIGYGYGPTDGTNYTFDLTDTYANADWGVYNAISNGGNTPNLWRTPSIDDWYYVFFERSTPSNILYAKAIVNGVKGVVLLPDNWNASVYALNYTNRLDAPFTTNEITSDTWSVLEANGAVFMPNAGFRYGTTIVNVEGWGYYWINSCSNSPDGGGYVFVNNDNLSLSFAFRYYGYSVRLVRDVQ